MPKPRPSPPPAPPPAPPELIRFVRENWPMIQWKTAVEQEVAAMMTGPGPWHITREHHALARQALMERGVLPPPGFKEPD